MSLYVIGFLAGISIGLFNPFISTLMAQHHVDDIWIGANSTEYFLAIALGTPLVAKLLGRIGLRWTMILGLALMGCSAPLFPLTAQLPLWFVIRAVMGIGCSLYLVCGQTALNNFCHESNRGTVNGLYALTFSFGFGLGPVVGSALYNISPKLCFSLGSLLILSGIVIVWKYLPKRFVVFKTSHTGLLKKIKKLELPLYCVFAFGLAEATLVSLYPVYLMRHNYSINYIGSVFFLFVSGGLLATVPVTYVADRFGKEKIISISLCIVICCLLYLSGTDNSMGIQIFTFLTGASMSPIFPLATALIAEKLSRNELISGSALLTAIYSFGCTLGPILSSVAIKTFGEHYMFSLLIATFALLLYRENPIFADIPMLAKFRGRQKHHA